jgi:hypothetical protein
MPAGYSPVNLKEHQGLLRIQSRKVELSWGAGEPHAKFWKGAIEHDVEVLVVLHLLLAEGICGGKPHVHNR